MIDVYSWPTPNGQPLGGGVAQYSKTVTDVQREEYGQARIDHTILKHYRRKLRNHVACLSGCLSSELQRAIAAGETPRYTRESPAKTRV